MALSGLSERFEQRYKELYSRYPLPEPGETNPLVTFQPNSPNRSETLHDSQAVFPGTMRREGTRLAKYLKSSKGLIFLTRQAELQTGNVFAETRLFNPIFLTSGIVPFRHFKRPVNSANGIQLSGNDVSPGSDARIGSAGRLQKETKERVIADRVGAKGQVGLLNLLFPNNKIVRTVSAVRNAVRGVNNIVGINDRPEIDFNGEMFSVATWRGFRSQGAIANPLTVASSQLRRGDPNAAFRTVVTGAKDILRGRTGLDVSSILKPNRSDSSNTGLAGYRYFLTGQTDADRYLYGSVQFESRSTGIAGQSQIIPTAQLGFLNQQPRPQHRTRSSIESAATAELKSATAKIKKSEQTIRNRNRRELQATNNFLKKVRTVGTFLFGADASPTKFIPISPEVLGPLSNDQDDLGRGRMIYPDLSIQSRYEAQLKSMGSSHPTETQTVEWKKTLTELEGTKFLGNTAGLRLGASRSTQGLGNRYIDDMNRVGPLFDNKGGTSVTAENVKSIREGTGNLIDFMFYDVVNKKILPFRAFLSDMNESVTPSFAEQPYIGRIERNIVFTGVTRDVSFRFRIQAFSRDELTNVWAKINYLTGMTYPSKYVDGFMSPPLTKLTIGNLYKDQPGYIKNLSYEWEDDDWEIDPDEQVPRGVTVSCNFSIIEKSQQSAGSEFYPVKGAWELIKPTTEPAMMPTVTIPG